MDVGERGVELHGIAKATLGARHVAVEDELHRGQRGVRQCGTRRELERALHFPARLGLAIGGAGRAHLDQPHAHLGQRGVRLSEALVHGDGFAELAARFFQLAQRGPLAEEQPARVRPHELGGLLHRRHRLRHAQHGPDDGAHAKRDHCRP